MDEVSCDEDIWYERIRVFPDYIQYDARDRIIFIDRTKYRYKTEWNKLFVKAFEYAYGIPCENEQKMFYFFRDWKFDEKAADDFKKWMVEQTRADYKFRWQKHIEDETNKNLEWTEDIIEYSKDLTEWHEFEFDGNNRYSENAKNRIMKKVENKDFDIITKDEEAPYKGPINDQVDVSRELKIFPDYIQLDTHGGNWNDAYGDWDDSYWKDHAKYYYKVDWKKLFLKAFEYWCIDYNWWENNLFKDRYYFMKNWKIDEDAAIEYKKWKVWDWKNSSSNWRLDRKDYLKIAEERIEYAKSIREWHELKYNWNGRYSANMKKQIMKRIKHKDYDKKTAPYEESNLFWDMVEQIRVFPNYIQYNTSHEDYAKYYYKLKWKKLFVKAFEYILEVPYFDMEKKWYDMLWFHFIKDWKFDKKVTEEFMTFRVEYHKVGFQQWIGWSEEAENRFNEEAENRFNEEAEKTIKKTKSFVKWHEFTFDGDKRYSTDAKNRIIEKIKNKNFD